MEVKHLIARQVNNTTAWCIILKQVVILSKLVAEHLSFGVDVKKRIEDIEERLKNPSANPAIKNHQPLEGSSRGR